MSGLRTPWLVTLATAAIAAGFVNFNVVWNHFYAGIPMLFDTGWYAHLVHRSAPLLMNPPSVAFATISDAFYSTHFSPLLWLLSWPTYVLPVGPQVWLAFLEALKHAAIAILVWCCVRDLLATRSPLRGPPTAAQRVLAPAVVWLAPFNGVLLACIAYTHFESWFVPLALGFFWTLLRGQLRFAIPFFVAAVLVREDVGAHLCAVLLVMAVAARWTRGSWDPEIRRWLGFAAAGFVWSIGALVVMKLAFPGDNALGRMYLGDPPFAHLAWSRLAPRLEVLLESRGYVWIPIVVYAAWAAISRAWWVLLGYAAFLPWLLLNIVAHEINPATLSLYYSYPFALALLWPLVGWWVFDRNGRRTRLLGWVTAAFALSIIGYFRGNDWPALARGMALPKIGTKPVYDTVVGELATARSQGVPVSVDDAVAAFSPGAFSAPNLFGQSPPGVELAALFANGRALKIGWETTQALPFHYEATGTPMIVVSEKPLSWPHLRLLSTAPGSVVPFLGGPNHLLAWEPSPEAIGADGGLRTICQGPEYWFFWAGETWSAAFTLSLDPADEAAADAAVVVCEVLARTGPETMRVIASTAISLPTQATGRIQAVRTLDFTVPHGGPGCDIAVRVRTPQRSGGRVEDIVVRRVEASPPQPPAVDIDATE